MAEAKLGKNVLLLFRKLGDKSNGALLMFQEEHSVDKSRDSDQTVTKTGNIATMGELTEEVSFTSLVEEGDPVYDLLINAIDNGDKLELWEVDANGASNNGKYPGIYRQGYLSELSETANAEDKMEIEGTFATDMKPQKGEVTFDPKSFAAAQYDFQDAVQVE